MAINMSKSLDILSKFVFAKILWLKESNSNIKESERFFNKSFCFILTTLKSSYKFAFIESRGASIQIVSHSVAITDDSINKLGKSV